MAINFGQIEKVDPTQRGTPFEPGLFVIEIVACKGVEGQRGDEFFVIECKVLKSDNEKVKEGGQYSQVINFSNKKAGNAPWADTKAFVCAALGIAANDKDTTQKIGQKMCLYVIGPDKPFTGLKMNLQCTQRPAAPPEKPTPFTYHKWESADVESSKLLREYMLENLAADPTAA